MRPTPPKKLVQFLDTLGVATEGQVRRVAGRAQRQARELPLFDSVWIDALTAARRITPFQASEIHAGRGDGLRIGAYLIEQRIEGSAIASWYCARRRALGDAQTAKRRRRPIGRQVRLAMLHMPAEQAEAMTVSLGQLAGALAEVDCRNVSPLLEFGTQSERLFATYPWRDGRTTARWMIGAGRFPPTAALAIARQTAAALVALHGAGIVHGDVGAASLLIDRRGEVTLLGAGLRPILRPSESLAAADLLPEAFDYLSPQRMIDAAPASPASDIYAGGCLFWHLLCGRPPLGGGDAAGKLRAVETARIEDPARHVPDAPAELLDTIRACTAVRPGDRPESARAVLEMLTTPDGHGRQRRPIRHDRRRVAYCARNPRPMLTGGWTSQFVAGRTPVRADSAGSLSPGVVLAVLLFAVILLGGMTMGCFSPGFRENVRQLALRCLSIDEPTVDEGNGAPAVTDNPKPLPHADVSGGSGGAGFDAQAEVVPRVPPNALSPGPGVNPSPPDEVFEGAEAFRVDAIELLPGQTVRGSRGERVVLIMPKGGLRVDVENIRFQGIDFVADEQSAGGALIELVADGTEFVDCSFQASPTMTLLPSAIKWRSAASEDLADSARGPTERDVELLPAGRIVMTGCRLRRIETGVTCLRRGDLAFQLQDVAYEGVGPLIQLEACPDRDALISVRLDRVMLVDSGSLLRVSSGTAGSPSGRVSIRADGSVFRCRPPHPLLRFAGEQSPVGLLEHLRWTGRDSTVDRQTPIATWNEQPVDDTTLSVEGLIRVE